MEATAAAITAIAIFVITTFLVWKLSVGRFKAEFGKKRRNVWGQRTFYWESIIAISTGITFLAMYLLRWADVLTFP
ncbi:hypothetical protein RB2501_07170 [Robiginitalea biformata HTCC2501]|uniref:Uncharacterized protein n=1 Tax=Robiginitalea biformata (strain ATCC BAA-864 / DSM 15991 / KCTC 12146 / HTCC2501) TaxID=313596 RepID=A4CIA4_ROBBH|nr:hypothetical protein RB2501_07170 [Robiginitalea biformata HTCC2501]